MRNANHGYNGNFFQREKKKKMRFDWDIRVTNSVNSGLSMVYDYSRCIIYESLKYSLIYQTKRNFHQ